MQRFVVCTTHFGLDDVSIAILWFDPFSLVK